MSIINYAHVTSQDDETYKVPSCCISQEDTMLRLVDCPCAGTVDLCHSMTRSGPLGAASSCNNTQVIQSWQRITSLLGQPQNYQYKRLITHQCCQEL